KRMTILNAQRLASPPGGPRHLTIYRPQLTWLACTTKRITGCSALPLYDFLSRLSRHPFTLTSANLIEYAAGLRKWVEITVLAAPFAFQSFNGLSDFACDAVCLLTHSLSVTESHRF
ncbi:hypothetical protein EDB83DRAFT_2221899, partial [Lactarius deliciosus]